MENDSARDVRESSGSMVGQERNYPYSGPIKWIVILIAGFMSLGLGVIGFLLIGFGLWLISKESTAGYQEAQ